jgi:pSer/pThr/pTyr-binding forkhead associated (FHA) protein
VRLIDRHVSRDHATLERSESGWAVTDIGSTWSTFVNGRAVPMGQLHPLVPGDVVEFGRPADPDVPATAFLVG